MEFARRSIAFVIACIGSLLLAGCGSDGDDGAGGSQSIASIAVSADTFTVGTAATQRLTATAKDQAGNTMQGVSFTWASSNTGIASIGSDGLVTGIAPGTSSITASAQGITSGPVSVTVVPATRITGTAAIGAPIAGAQITLTDHQGVRRTATAGADGLFVVTTTGLQLPFLIRAEPSAQVSAPLYSASAESASGVVNITPFTDLIVRSWYGAQSFSVDAAFSDPSRSPAVTTDSLQLVHSVVLNAARRWLDEAGVDTATLNLISSAFDADGAGIDRVLDRTSIDTASGSLVITDGTTTQNSRLSFQAAPLSITLETNVSSPSGSTRSKTQTLLPLQPEEQAAVEAVNALLVEVTRAAETAGPNSTGEEVAAFFSEDYLHSGVEIQHHATRLVRASRGYDVSYRLRSIDSLDAANGLMTATFDRTRSRKDNQGSYSDRVQHYFKRYGSEWLFHGDQREADVSVSTEARTYQGAITTGSGTSVIARMNYIRGYSDYELRGARVSGGGIWNNSRLISSGDYKYARYVLDSGPLTTPVPDGANFAMAVEFVQMPLTTYQLSTNAFTTDAVTVTNLTSHALADALGQTLRLEWSWPTSYAVQTVRLTRSWRLQDPATGAAVVVPDEEGPLVLDTASSGLIQIPAAYDDRLIVTGVDVNVIVEGVNGERSVAVYAFR